MRGFLSQTWIHYKPSTRPIANQHTGSAYNATKTFGHIIQELWKAQLNFWQAYQAARHQQSSNPNSETDPASHIQELQETIQYLHSKQPQVEYSRDTVYFPSNPTAFAETNHPRSLRNYIQNYGPAIQQSIQRRLTQATSRLRNIWQYNGFSRRHTHNVSTTTNTSHREVRNPTSVTAVPQRSIPPARHHPADTEGQLIPHKHSRWKITHVDRARFRSFFK